MMILSFFLASLINVFVVESPSYAKEMVAAAHELTAQHPELRFTIRTTEQVIEMQTDDLRQSLAQASVVVMGRTYGDVAIRKSGGILFPRDASRPQWERICG